MAAVPRLPPQQTEHPEPANLFRLQTELRAHTYRPGRSICFVTDGPKPREVFAADFRDRVVYHLLVAQHEPGFERRFIHDSFACRRGKGTLAASDRLMTFLRQATANGRRPAWAGQPMRRFSAQYWALVGRAGERVLVFFSVDRAAWSLASRR